MSLLLLVRHGQASFFAEDYDNLSATGKEQSRLLGLHWARQHLRFDAVFTGPRRRHRETAALAGACMRDAGVPWPEPVVLDEFDEHPVQFLLKSHGPALAARDERIRTLAAQFTEAKSDVEKQRSFQKLFEAFTHRWSRGELDTAPSDSWLVFRERVARGIARITDAAGHGRRVAVFTSTGPISVALQHALGMADRVALETGWRVWNASQTGFVFTQDRFTLDTFNTVAHLEDQSLWTYR